MSTAAKDKKDSKHGFDLCMLCISDPLGSARSETVGMTRYI